ncbi:pilus assembly protein [Alcaligenaceae bacterium]|nr:pilus assembly protein [Alcaligenaceae bacterium]
MLPFTTYTLHAQRGASLIEFSVVAVPLLLIGLGALEVSLWLFTKQAVSLALLQAGRAAIVDHANPHTIETAFEQAMLPLFRPNQQGSSQQRLHAALAQRQQATGAAPWQIQRLSPSPAAFIDFHDPKLQLAGAQQRATINNNYLAEQHERQQQKGYAQGHGPTSGHTVFQANTLVLRLHWLHQPVVPGVAALLRQLGNVDGSYSQRAMALGGYLPISQDISLVMQSHPVDWPMLANGKVINQAATPNTSVANTMPACVGFWCLRTPKALGLIDTTDTGSESNTSLPIVPKPADPTGQEVPAETPLPDIDTPTPNPDDMVCGISLCCVD